MSKPYDASLKWLLEYSPRDWAALAGYPGKRAEVIDADVSSVTAASDKVIRVGSGKSAWLLDLNFQSGPDASLPRRMCMYNVLLGHRHGLPVRSVAILLTRKAGLKAIDGTYQVSLPGDGPYLSFRYSVIKVWQLKPEELIAPGPATTPLAPLGDVKRSELPGLVRTLGENLRGVNQGIELLTAAGILMGLRFEDSVIRRLMMNSEVLEDSTFYQWILQRGREEGMAEGVRQILLGIAERTFGSPPPASVLERVRAINDHDRLEELIYRVPAVDGWDALLDPPARKAPRKSKKSRGRP